MQLKQAETWGNIWLVKLEVPSLEGLLRRWIPCLRTHVPEIPWSLALLVAASTACWKLNGSRGPKALRAISEGTSPTRPRKELSRMASVKCWVWASLAQTESHDHSQSNHCRGELDHSWRTPKLTLAGRWSYGPNHTHYMLKGVTWTNVEFS